MQREGWGSRVEGSGMQVQDLDLGIWGPEMRFQALDDDVDDKDDHYTIGDGAGDGDSDDDDHHHHYHHHHHHHHHHHRHRRRHGSRVMVMLIS